MRHIGPVTAKIMIIGEAPSASDLERGTPFYGLDKRGEPYFSGTGMVLKEMLQEAGIDITKCYLTNALSVKPPKSDIDEWVNTKKTPRIGEITWRGRLVHPCIPQEQERLMAEIEFLKPDIIITLGNTALWFVTGENGIAKWRGSTIPALDTKRTKVVAAFHPVLVMRVWKYRYLTVRDFKRGLAESKFPELRKPAWNFTIAPSPALCQSTIDDLLKIVAERPLKIVIDLEIRYNTILCLGIATSTVDAICIPIFDFKGKAWFTELEYIQFTNSLRDLLGHPNIRLCNQNILFDLQFLYWEMLIYCKTVYCTMTGGHVIFPSIEKALHTQCSLYSDYYRYWKDDGKFWVGKVTITDEQLWYYNCEDCVNTFDLWEKQEAVVAVTPSLAYPISFQMRVLNHVHRMMLRGVKVDVDLRNKMLGDVMHFISVSEAYVAFCILRDINVNSYVQLAELFYTTLAIPPMRNKKKKVSCDETVMKEMAVKYPMVAHLCYAITISRSYSITAGAISSGVDKDGRWRCSYIVPGTKTYRFASKKNAYGTGLNLQNITKGGEIEVR